MPFITVIDTVFEGRTASWRDEEGKPVIFATPSEALDECEEDDGVVEVVVTPDKIYDPIDERVYWEAECATEV